MGKTKDEFWSAIKEGKCGIGLVERFDTTGYTTIIGAEIKDFDPGQYMDKKEAKRIV